MGSQCLVILAAGRGRRFGGDKQLAPVGPNGETIMEYTIADAGRVGFQGVILVTRPDMDAALRRLGSLRECRGLAVEIVHQPPDAHGTVAAVLAARSRVGHDAFAVVNADDLYPRAALAALQAWNGPGHAVVGFALEATMFPHSRPVNRALCHLGPDDRVVRLVEASLCEREDGFVAVELGSSEAVAVPPGQLVSMNAWALAASVWAHLAAAAAGASGGAASGGGGSGGGAAALLPVVMGGLVAAGGTVTCLPVAGECLGLTWRDELGALRTLVARRGARPIARGI